MTQESGRDATFQRLRADTLDLLVAGGGIVGSGIARDAAMRGLNEALIPQFDNGTFAARRGKPGHGPATG